MTLTDLEKHKYDNVIEKVLKFEVTPSAAMKEIGLLKSLESEKYNTFTFPDSNGLEPKIHLGDKEDLLMTLKEKEVSVVFFECSNLNRTTDSLSSYALKSALQVKPFTEERLKDTGSLMIYTKEVYQNGFASRFPNILIEKSKRNRYAI